MKRAFVAVILVLTVLVPAVQAQISKTFLVDRGAQAYTDSLLWHNGTYGAKPCTLIAHEKDTSQVFDLANIDVFSAMFWHTKGQGRAGDSLVYSLSCSLQVSIDGTNWNTYTGIPIYSTAASTTVSKPVIRVYATYGDSAVTITDIAGPRGRAYVTGSKYGRFVVRQYADNKDTCYFKAVDFRLYRPVIR